MFWSKDFNSKNFRKCFLFALLFSLFLLHSLCILRYYFRYEKFDEVSSELQWPIEFPDVTVCDNQIVSPRVEGTKSVFTKRNELEYVRVLSFAKEQYSTTEAHSCTDFIQRCEFLDHNVTCKKFKHFNYFYGDCTTISLGEKPNSDVPIAGIVLQGNLDAEREKFSYQFLRQPSFVMVIHRPETPPVFLRENLIFGDYFGEYVIHLKKKVVNRVDCFEEEDLVNKKIPGVKNGTKYSYEACLTSCYQNFTFSQCGCILPQFYFADNEYRYPVCTGCRGDFTLDLSRMCECKPLCKDVEWEWNLEDVTYNNEIEGLNYNKEIAYLDFPLRRSFLHLSNRNQRYNFEESSLENDYDFRQSLKDPHADDVSGGRNPRGRNTEICHLNLVFRVRVEYETAEVTIVNEKLLLGKFGLIAAIGGSICLFFGTNVLRALQLVCLELFYFFNQTEQKLNLLNRAKVDFNLRRVLVVLKQLLWLLPTVAFTVLSGLLSGVLINDYLNFSPIQHPSIAWKQNFPAVTVCSGVPVSWNKYNNQSEFVRQLVKEMRDVVIKYPLNLKKEHHLQAYPYYDILHRKLHIRSQKEREENGLKLDEYIKKCTWSYRGLNYNCSEAQFVQFNNHKYGNCATFNHGSLTNESNNEPIIDDVEMMLSFNQLEVPIGRNGLPGLIVHLHERGTAPLFAPSTTHLIRAFSFNHITFTSEKHRFSSRNCVDGADAEMREKSVYQDERRQYLHTMKSCLESCFQKLTREEIRCRSCYQPLMLGKYDVVEENTCTTFCPWIDEELLADKCGCKQHCDSIEYKTQISTSNFNKSANNSFEIENDRGHIDFTIDGNYNTRIKRYVIFAVSRTIFPDGNCGLTVSAQKDIENVFYQTPKTTLANVLGLVGGIMGFLQALLTILRSLRIFIDKSP